jgi:DNA-binding CsgD family transcriptional regulator
LKPFSIEEMSATVGRIYDCAVDPALWAPTLTAIRDKMDLAYVHINFFDQSNYQDNPNTRPSVFQSEWPFQWIEMLPQIAPTIPGIEKWMALDIDQSRSQLQFMAEAEFHQTSFFNDWVKPQGLRDYCYTSTAKREKMSGAIGAATYQSRDLISAYERQVFSLLAPHVRRSLMISGMLDDGKLQLQLYRSILDRIGAGVIIVGANARLLYANELADAMLSKGTSLTVRHTKVKTARDLHQKSFDEALSRAATENDDDLGYFGNGIPLTGTDGSIAVCYVLPLGKSDRRRELGSGLAAIFVTMHGESIPPALEVLSALSGMTSSESRVALMVADGYSTAEIASALDISINTLRKHLMNVYEKSGVNSQQSLIRFIGGLSLPVTATKRART